MLLNSFGRIVGASVVSVLASVTDNKSWNMGLTVSEHYGLPNARATGEQEEDMGSGGNVDFGANQNSTREDVSASEWTAKA